jgi:hypothetical protein
MKAVFRVSDIMLSHAVILVESVMATAIPTVIAAKSRMVAALVNRLGAGYVIYRRDMSRVVIYRFLVGLGWAGRDGLLRRIVGDGLLRV